MIEKILLVTIELVNMNKEEIVNRKLKELSKSTFRNKFKLKESDIRYINDNGINVIRKHAYVFIIDRLSGYPISHDGKQTPMKGHPVFVAQHACGCCCRGCLSKWHGITKDRCLSKNEVNYIVELIMTWINRQL